MSVATINKNLNRVSSLFDWAKKHGYVRDNYFEVLVLKKEKQAKRKEPYLTKLKMMVGHMGFLTKNIP